MDRHLVIAAYQIYLRKKPGAVQVRRTILNVWDRITVRRRGVIEPAEIPTRPPTTLALGDHV